MNTTVRTCLTAGVSVITATAVAFVPSVAAPSAHPTAPPAAVRVVAQPIELTAAAIQPLSTPLPTLLNDWLQRIVARPSATAAAPAPDFPPQVTVNGIDDTIKNVYNRVEPWVQYGFEWVAYAVGWVPWVGWLSPQVMIFYRLGESIVHSIVFNVADWLGGSINFGQGLWNVGRDTVDAFIAFGSEQWHFWLPNIPLPPRWPGLPGLTAKQAAPGPLARLADIVQSAGSEAPAIHNPAPILRNVRDGRLATFVQKITARDTSSGRASLGVRTLGQAQTLPRAHDLVGKVRSTVRNFASSRPHPVRDHIAAATAKAKGD